MNPGRFGRACVSALASVALLAAGPLPGLPAPGGHDPRRRIDIAAAPWRAVALLQVPGLGRCTAFMAAPLIAVTAAHCLWGARLARWAPPQAIHVLTGYASGRFAHHSLARAFRIAPGYDPAHVAQTRGADVAVVLLEDAVLAADAALPLAGAAPAGFAAAPDAPPASPPGAAPAGAAVALGGYDQDAAEVIEADTACHLRAASRDLEGRVLLAHDCAATHGSSGAPLLARGADGVWRVLGVQVAGSPGVVGGLAVPAAVVRVLLAAP